MAQRIEFIDDIDFETTAGNETIRGNLAATLSTYAQHGWSVFQIEETQNPKGMLVFLQK